MWVLGTPLDKLAYVLFPFVLVFYIWFLYKHPLTKPIEKHTPIKNELNKDG